MAGKTEAYIKCSDPTGRHKSKVHVCQLLSADTIVQDTGLRVDKMDFENFLLLRDLLWALFSE